MGRESDEHKGVWKYVLHKALTNPTSYIPAMGGVGVAVLGGLLASPVGIFAGVVISAFGVGKMVFDFGFRHEELANEAIEEDKEYRRQLEDEELNTLVESFCQLCGGEASTAMRQVLEAQRWLWKFHAGISELDLDSYVEAETQIKDLIASQLRLARRISKDWEVVSHDEERELVAAAGAIKNLRRRMEDGDTIPPVMSASSEQESGLARLRESAGAHDSERTRAAAVRDRQSET